MSDWLERTAATIAGSIERAVFTEELARAPGWLQGLDPRAKLVACLTTVMAAGFLRSLDEAKLITPQRSAGGHRRYSRYQLRLAARARELVDQGTPLEAACRIIILEDQLAEALRLNNTQKLQDH